MRGWLVSLPITAPTAIPPRSGHYGIAARPKRGTQRLLAGGSLHPSTGEDGLRRTLSAPPSTVGVSFRPSALGCRTYLWRSPTFQMFHTSDTRTSMRRHQGNPQVRRNDIGGKLLETSFPSITPTKFGKGLNVWGGALRRERATPRAAGHTVFSLQEVCPAAHGLCRAVRVR